MSKQAKKRPKRPKPVFGWAVVDDGKIQGEECFNTRSDADWYLGYRGNDIIRVRIVPVVAKAKRRKEEPAAKFWSKRTEGLYIDKSVAKRRKGAK